jgi:O-antigen ligase
LGYHLIGFDLLSKYPLLGIGPDNFADYYTKFEYRWMPGRTLTPRVLHNMYLAVAVEVGLLAALAFIGTLGFALHGCWMAKRVTQSPRLALYAEAALFGAIMLYLVSATLPNETNKYVWIYAGLAAATARIEYRRNISRAS